MASLNEQVCRRKEARKNLKENKYREALDSIPAPGCGGCTHARILGAANHGIRAGHNVEEVCKEIRVAVPAGRLWVKMEELDHRQRLQKALFPEGLAYHQKNGFGTAVNTYPVRVLQEFSAEKSRMAPPRGIEPLFPG